MSGPGGGPGSGPGDLADTARAVADALAGRPVAEAVARVAAHPGLVLRQLPPDAAVTLEFRAGRVNAVVEDGTVTRAWAG